MDMNPMLPPSQFARHPMAPDYDSPMMDLSVRNNNQFPGDHQQQQQDFMNKMLMSGRLSGEKDTCDGPVLPSSNGGGVGGTMMNNLEKGGLIMDAIDISRRQNPVGVSVPPRLLIN